MSTVYPFLERNGIPECFCITAPRRRERFDWEGKLGKVLFHGEASGLVFYLAKPYIWNEEDTEEVDDESEPRPKGDSSVIQENCPILNMPHEIFGCICESLDIKDTFRLGMTCKELWPVGKCFIDAKFKKTLGIWAGVPLVCPGSTHSKEINSYPPGILTSAGEEELSKGLCVGELASITTLYHVPGFDEIKQQYYKTNLFSLALRRYEALPAISEAIENMIPVQVSDQDEINQQNEIARLTKFNPSVFYPMEEKWILRNLTTRQFVRAEEIALSPGYIHGPLIEILGFAEVVIAKSCWANNTSTWVRYPLNKGPWAGHSFDVVPISKVEMKDWEDISPSIAAELATICEQQYGSAWKEVLIRRFEQKHMDPWGFWRKETLWEKIQRQARDSWLGFFWLRI